MTLLSISIVAGRSRNNLARCLVSLESALDGISFRLIVTDNAVGWDPAPVIESAFADAELIRNKEMMGFAENHNRALDGRDDDFALVLNDDIEVHPESIKFLVEAAEESPESAVFGPSLYPGSWDSDPISAGGALGESLPKPVINLVSVLVQKLFGRAFIRAMLRRRSRKRGIPDGPLAYISGACCMVRRSFIEKHGLYDPEFPMYYEDIDLGKRVREAGFECRQVSKAKVMHLEGASFSKGSYSMICAGAKRYSRKYHGIFTRMMVSLMCFFIRMLPGG